MTFELVQWVREGKPDADRTVLLYMPGAEGEQVWPGYWDGEDWLLADGAPAPSVEAWAEMPDAQTTRMAELAVSLADSTAIADIECHTIEASGPGLPKAESHDRYYDADSADAEDRNVVAEAVEYLGLRGILERHPAKQRFVRFRRG